MTKETLPDLLSRLYAERYTGAVVLQFGQGVPRCVEIPQAPARIPLDTAPPQGRHLTRLRSVATDARDDA